MKVRLLGLILLTSMYLSLPWSHDVSAERSPSALQNRPVDIISKLGIGSTREDILKSWNISASTEPVLEFIYEHKQDVTYDTKDMEYQISLMFQLQFDDKPRPVDRAVLVVLSLISFIDGSSAERLISQMLPTDAEKKGRMSKNRFGEPVQQYSSKEIAKIFPKVEIEGEPLKTPGRIWVTIYPSTSRVGVIEMSLFDTSVN